mgnify:CR=1 FL=1
MNTIEVNEEMLKALLELLLKTNDCFVIVEALDEETHCYEEGCAEEGCPFFNIENLIKYLNGEWDEEHDY